MFCVKPALEIILKKRNERKTFVNYEEPLMTCKSRMYSFNGTCHHNLSENNKRKSIIVKSLYTIYENELNVLVNK